MTITNHGSPVPPASAPAATALDVVATEPEPGILGSPTKVRSTPTRDDHA